MADGAFTSDGQLVTVSETNEVRFWDLLSGEEDEPRRRTLTTAFGNQTRALSPDGRLMAVTADDEVHLLDVTSGERLWKIDSRSYRYRSLTFSTDGKQLVVVDDDGIRWLNTNTGEVVGTLDGAGSPRKGVSLSLDGRTLALVGLGVSGQEVAVFRLNPEDGKVARQMQDIDNTGTVGAAALSPDGRLVAVGSAFVGFLTIYEADTGKQVARHLSAHRSPISALAFSEDGSQLSSAGTDGTINIWTDFEEFSSASRPVGTLKGHSSATTRLRFSFDGRQLLSTSQDESARVWDVANIGVSIAWGMTGISGFPAACFSPDGRLCAVATGSQVSLFDTSSGKRVRVLGSQSGLQAASVSFSPTDQTLLAVGYGGKPNVPYVALWDIDKAVEKARLSITSDLIGYSLDETKGVVGTLRFSPDGRHLVVGTGSPWRFIFRAYSTPLLVWDVRERRNIQRLAGHTGSCVALDFSSDGMLLASGSHDGRVIVWSTGTWQELRQFRNPDLPALRDRAGYGGPPVNESVVVTSVAFSPDDKTLAMASHEGSIHLWDVTSGNHLAALTGHSNAVTDVAFAPDGRTMASTSTDGTVRLWNMATHRELMELDSGKLPVGRGSTLAFSPDGKQLLAGGTSHVLAWSAAPRAWRMTRQPARQLESLLVSNKDFRGAIRLGSQNVRLYRALEQLDSTDRRVVAALAATRAHWHASEQRWAEAARETERFRETDSESLDEWLDSQGVIRVAQALLHNGQPSEASDLIAAVNRNLKRDGVTRNSLIGIRSELGSFPVRLVAVYSGTPAARAGLRIGDMILKVNDQEITADNANQVTGLLKGDPGTRIQLLVRHSDSDEDEQIELIKELVLSDQQVRDQILALRDEVQVRMSEDSPSAGLLSLRAELRGLVGRVSEQVADYTQAIALLSSKTDNQAGAGLGRLYRRRGDARLKRKEWSLALEDYNRVVNDETVDEDLLVNHAAAQTGVILDELDSQIDDGITDPWVRLAAAWQLKDDQPAIDEIVRKRPQLAGAIGDLFLQGDSKNVTRAIDVFSVGITANEEDSELLIKRAQAYEETGNWEAAIADWSRAAPDDFRGAQLLADLARRLVPTEFHTQAEAQRTEARRILQELLEADPNDGPVIATLTQVLLDQLELPQWAVLIPAAAKTEGGAAVQTDTDGSIQINSSETDSLALLAGETEIKSIRIETEASSDSPQSGTAEFRTHRVEPVGVHRSPGGGISGRYVRIDLPGVNVDVLGGNSRSAALSLAEVQVFRKDVNIAVGKDARMSHPSIYDMPGVYAPEIAVDGDTVSYVISDHLRRINPSGSDVQPSWEVDLAKMQAIDRIVVWNQGEADLIQLRVRVLDSERNIVFEEFIERGQAPSTEVNCHSLLTSAPTDGDPAEPRLILGMPTGFAGTTTGKRFRVSGSSEFLPLDHDQALAEAANIRAGAGRLAAALAIAGDVDQAVNWFDDAFDQTDLTHERRPALQFLRGQRDIVLELLRRRPDDFDIQLAAARHLIAQGKTAIATGNSADGLTELRNADDILSRLLDTGTGWTALKPNEAASSTATGSQLDFHDDLSVFVKKAAVNDTFILEFDAPAEQISGFRLEALTDPRLKESGPGVKGYFHTTRLLLKGLFPKSRVPDAFSSIEIRDAWADRNSLTHTRRGNLRDGSWHIHVPYLGEQHVAVFETRDTQDKGSPTRLQLRLLQAGTGALGRFRVSVTSDPATVRSSRLRLVVTDDDLVDF